MRSRQAMTQFIPGTPGTIAGIRLLLLGSGELGREVAIEAVRLGLEVIACDRYAGAPAMAVAHRCHVFDMRDPASLAAVVALERPHLIVPEVEAIATDALARLESRECVVVPTARATRLTMDREGIRRLAAEQLGLPTSNYRFAGSAVECAEAISAIGLPCVVKPVMSSSGKGQVYVREPGEIATAFDRSTSAARGGAVPRVIVESFIDFEFELTLLTVRCLSASGEIQTRFCPPIGHIQEGGDYQASWQPHPVSASVLSECQRIAAEITAALAETDLGPSDVGLPRGLGLFGVELFVGRDTVWFSEVSPRPHDTGLVTLKGQALSEFALHVRAILGLPIDEVRSCGPAASAVITGHGNGTDIRYHGLAEALALPETAVYLFGKPDVRGARRLGVAVAGGDTLDAARSRAKAAADAIAVRVEPPVDVPVDSR